MPNFFTINGKAYPDTEPIRMKVGERLRVRFIGTQGAFVHPMHIHGGPFEIAETDGNPVPRAGRWTKDTVDVGPGERYDVIWTARRPGRWLLHCHIAHHTTNNNVEENGAGGADHRYRGVATGGVRTVIRSGGSEQSLKRLTHVPLDFIVVPDRTSGLAWPPRGYVRRTSDRARRSGSVREQRVGLRMSNRGAGAPRKRGMGARRLAAACAAVGLLVVMAPVARANHAAGTLSSPVGNPVTPTTLVDGNWSFIANYPAGPAVEQPIGVDVEPFTRRQSDGLHRYLIASSMTTGFSIFDVTNPAAPIRVSDYGSAVCGPEAQVQQLIDVLGRGGDFDVGSTALGAVHGWEDDIQVTPDGTIAVIATDAAGRCHDPASGGMEIVDISNLAQPRLLGLVRLPGESHNTTIDRDRPSIIYNSNSDSGGNNFIDVVDMTSCLSRDPARCRPSVARFQFKDAWTTGTRTPDPSACHDLDYVGKKLYGGCINTSLVLDVSGVWKNGRLNGTDLTDPGQVGDRACTLQNPSPEALANVKVVDCRGWTTDAWKQSGARPVNMRVLTVIPHAGANLDEDAPPDEDIQISHQATPLAGGKVVIVSDERGGGLNAPPGECPGGGLWFFDVRDPSHPQVARTPEGQKAIFLPTPNDTVQTAGANCTAHVFHPWTGETGMITEAWYSSGTQVFRYAIDLTQRPARVRFFNRQAYVPSGASTWTSRVYDETTGLDGSRTLYFFATDISRGFDFFKLTLPPQ